MQNLQQNKHVRCLQETYSWNSNEKATPTIEDYIMLYVVKISIHIKKKNLGVVSDKRFCLLDSKYKKECLCTYKRNMFLKKEKQIQDALHQDTPDCKEMFTK